MGIPFFKYQGTGNDFILIDNRTAVFDPSNLDRVKRLCHRNFGIGSDGLILIQEASSVDFEMVFFNPDGSQSLCGNGSRCAVMFAQHLGIIHQNASFLTIDGPLKARIDGRQVILELKDITTVEFLGEDIFIFNGSPHYLSFRSGVSDLNVYDLAQEIRYSDRFKKNGTNVNFVEVLSTHEILNRTYERGVENETLSCGTGVVAASIGSSYHQVQSPVHVKTPGGNLTIEFEQAGNDVFTNIKLIGPAEMVFEGSILA